MVTDDVTYINDKKYYVNVENYKYVFISEN